MDLKLNILGLASQLAAHSAARHKLISENIAHADTPGYRARDLLPFAETHGGQDAAFAARTTRSGHIPFGAPQSPPSREEAAFGTENPNGNTVSLEDQMMRAADTRQAHDLALGVYGKTLDILRSGLRSR